MNVAPPLSACLKLLFARTFGPVFPISGYWIPVGADTDGPMAHGAWIFGTHGHLYSSSEKIILPRFYPIGLPIYCGFTGAADGHEVDTAGTTGITEVFVGKVFPGYSA